MRLGDPRLLAFDENAENESDERPMSLMRFGDFLYYFVIVCILKQNPTLGTKLDESWPMCTKP